MSDSLETFTFEGVEYERVLVTADLRLRQDDAPAEVCEQAKAANAMFTRDADSPDLINVEFVLDTEGVNANWDYMPRPVLASRFGSAKFKPMNMNHVVKEAKSMLLVDKKDAKVENTIFGVMTGATLCDVEGNNLSVADLKKYDMTDELDRKGSDRLAVKGYASMWSFMFPKTVEQMLKTISTGSMKVSMERWISTLDYLVWDKANSKYEPCDRETAKTNGYDKSWADQKPVNDKPIYRRSLDFIYGGVASTMSPANKYSVFTKAADKAVASFEENDEVLKFLEKQHSEVHAKFAVSTGEDQSALIDRHARLHRAIAGYLGVIGNDK